jgi:hypothetical protein
MYIMVTRMYGKHEGVSYFRYLFVFQFLRAFIVLLHYIVHTDHPSWDPHYIMCTDHPGTHQSRSHWLSY